MLSLFSLCQVVEVHAPGVPHVDVDSTPQKSSIIDSAKLFRGKWLILRAVFRRTSLPRPVERARSGKLPTSGCMSSKPIPLVRTRRMLRNSLEDISMPVVEEPCPTAVLGACNERYFS